MVALDIDKKIRNYQSKQIQESQGTYSYSKALNVLLAKGISVIRKGDEEKYLFVDKKRVTVMFNPEILKKLKILFGKEIIECANNYCELPQMSFSKEVDKQLRKVFR